MARAAINVTGAGEKFDFVSLGGADVSCYRKDVGVYCVTGTQGMVPFPPIDQGWGYGLHPADNPAEVDIDFDDGLLTVTVTKEGEPYDLKVMITLHILVPDLPPQEELPPPALDPVVAAQTQIAHLRAEADYAIAPLQDAVDIDEGTEAELATLKAWKKYRVALSRVPEQDGYPLAIDWPAAP